MIKKNRKIGAIRKCWRAIVGLILPRSFSEINELRREMDRLHGVLMWRMREASDAIETGSWAEVEIALAAVDDARIAYSNHCHRQARRLAMIYKE